MFTNNDIVRKPLEYNAYGTAFFSDTGDRRDRNNILFEEVKSIINGLLKFYSESWVFSLGLAQ